MAFSWTVETPPVRLAAGSVTELRVVLTNRSPAPWPGEALAGTDRPLRAAYHWTPAGTRTPIPNDGVRAEIPTRVPPGARLVLLLPVKAPVLPGDYLFEVDLIQEFVAWFSEASPLRSAPLPVRVVEGR